MKLKLLLLPLFVLYTAIISAQIQKKSSPYSFENSTLERLDIKNEKKYIPSKSIEEALQEDEFDKEYGTPPRFGLKIDTDTNTKNSGKWTELPNGDKIWRLLIKSPGALSISLLYDYFHLPFGGKLHIYNTSKTQVIGAFTEYNNKGSLKAPGKFATGLVYGDEIIVEYYHPRKAVHEPIISIKGVVHGYKYIRLPENIDETDTGTNGGSGTCQVNVNCTEGNAWQDEKRGVAMLLIDDCTRWCSGSLINNSQKDGTPYFLTADHCLTEDGLDAATNTDASLWMFYWNYEAPGCANPAIEPAINSTTGAVLRANRADTDFALFELTESPVDAGFNVYFNGWSRTTSPGTGGVGIHHPSGDIKKIATHTMVPVNGTEWGSDHWRVNWDATANGHSVTEGGSSGSPLFRGNGQIIGQLHGGSSVDCSDPTNDPGEYGKFHLSWNGSSSIRRLRDWLGTSFSTNGRYFCDNLSISGPTKFCPSGNFKVNVADGTNVTWSVSPSSAGNFSQNGPTTTFTRNGSFSGFATISANIGSPCNTTIAKNITIEGTMNFTWNGVGPFGQLDVNVTSGTAPYKIYRGSTLLYSGSLNPRTVNFGCNGGVLKVEANTVCGIASKSVIVPQGCASFRGQSTMVVFPNPTSSELNITQLDEYKDIRSEDDIGSGELQLYDFDGNEIKAHKFSRIGSDTKMDVTDLRKGIYLLRIVAKEVDEVHRVVIE